MPGPIAPRPTARPAATTDAAVVMDVDAAEEQAVGLAVAEASVRPVLPPVERV